MTRICRRLWGIRGDWANLGEINRRVHRGRGANQNPRRKRGAEQARKRLPFFKQGRAGVLSHKGPSYPSRAPASANGYRPLESLAGTRGSDGWRSGNSEAPDWDAGRSVVGYGAPTLQNGRRGVGRYGAAIRAGSRAARAVRVSNVPWTSSSSPAASCVFGGGRSCGEASFIRRSTIATL
jgi:hypothetical protein